jgi:F-type H+-transporting ATPase subunit gamma
MVSPRLLRRRIRSVQSTAKITRAMEMIATAKMKRAQDMALAGRPYAEKISHVIGDLVATQTLDAAETPPLLQVRDVKRIGIVHVTTDRGLCGGLNSNLNRTAAGFVLKSGKPVSAVVVGKKGRNFLARSGVEIRAEFSGLGDRPSLMDILPVARVVMEDYASGYVDVVYLSYPRFVTTMVQRPEVDQLLPVEASVLPSGGRGEYIYEPDPHYVLGHLLPRFIEMELYHAILESIASEQSARMVAMRSATDNAKQLIEELTLTLNKARQEMITTELLDITGGVAAIA